MIEKNIISIIARNAIMELGIVMDRLEWVGAEGEDGAGQASVGVVAHGGCVASPNNLER